VGDDTAAIKAAASADYGYGINLIYIDPPSVAYRTTGGIQVLSDMTFRGNKSEIHLIGDTVNLFEFTALAQNSEIDSLVMYGDNEANTWAVNFIGTAGVVGNSIQIKNCEIRDFGDLATGSGGGVYVQADTARLSIGHNLISGYGTGVLINAPADGLDIFDNHMSGGNMRAVDVVQSAGSATLLIRHNIMSNLNGAIRIQGTSTTYVMQNEFEGVLALTNGSSAPYEFLSPNIYADGNYAHIAATATYCYYIADSLFNLTISNNRGSTTGDRTIIRVGSGTGSNRYINNISYNADGINLYSDPTHSGIFSWPVAASALSDYATVANGNNLGVGSSGLIYSLKARTFTTNPTPSELNSSYGIVNKAYYFYNVTAPSVSWPSDYGSVFGYYQNDNTHKYCYQIFRGLQNQPISYRYATGDSTWSAWQNMTFSVAVPATAAATGTAGQIAFDTSYVYLCVAADTWMRASIATW